MRDVHLQCISVNADARIGPGAYKFTVMSHFTNWRAGKEISSSLGYSDLIESTEHLPTDCV
jgi:hypothetical protein